MNSSPTFGCYFRICRSAQSMTHVPTVTQSETRGPGAAHFSFGTNESCCPGASAFVLDAILQLHIMHEQTLTGRSLPKQSQSFTLYSSSCRLSSLASAGSTGPSSSAGATPPLPLLPPTAAFAADLAFLAPCLSLLLFPRDPSARSNAATAKEALRKNHT